MLLHKQHLPQQLTNITLVHENKCKHDTTISHGRVLCHPILRRERICIRGNNGRNIWTHSIRLLSQPIPNKNITPFGYYPSKITPGIWHHKTRPIKFTILLYEFGVKYVNKEDAQHFLDFIEAN